MSKSLAERISARIVIDPETGCHVWTASVTHNGYGQVGSARGPGKSVRAHRAAYELAKGPIPAGMQIDHLCRNRRCCNPDHLEAVTPRENTLRGTGTPAVNAKRTHCAQGHEFTPENTAPRANGGRKCRACIRMYQKRQRDGAAR